MDSEKYSLFVGCQVLEQEIEKMCAAVQTSGLAERQAVVQRFRNIICGQINRSVKVEYFGSSSTGLFVKDSDVDLAILVPADQLQEGCARYLAEIYNYLVAGKGIWHLDQVKLNTAPFPLVKAVDTQSGLKVEIICDALGGVTSGLQNSQWIRWAIAQYPSAAYLVVILKHMLRHNDLPNISGRGISSYVLTLMVISYVQHADPQYNLGDLLLGILYLYGYDFDYQNEAIVLTNGGRIVDKRQVPGLTDPPHHKFIIQDPVKPTQNAAKRSLGGLGNVLDVFRKAYDASQSVGMYPVKDFAMFWKWFLTAKF